MITDKQSNDHTIANSSALALAVLVERIQSLPEADKDDLFELSKVLFTTNEPEERESARVAMQEILDQQCSNVSVMAMPDGPGDDLKKWTEFVGEKIKELRKAAKLTQSQLEEKTGLPQSHISRLENGEHSPSFATLEKIANALGIPVSEIDPCAP